MVSPTRHRHARVIITLLATGTLLAGTAVAVASPPGGTPAPPQQLPAAGPAGTGPLVYDAEIRRTEFGIPHIKAGDYESLGFGAGYAFAEDNLCLLARRIVEVNAEQARYFGPAAANVQNDFLNQRLIDSGVVENLLAGGPDQPVPSAAVQAMIRGYAAGYSRYLRDTGVDELPDPTCRGAAWIREIDETDLWRHFVGVLLQAGTTASGLAPAIFAATPPSVTGATTQRVPDQDELADAVEELVPELADAAEASNAYGLGRDATVDGTGMLLGNPHFPWHGHLRFYRMHLTLPGELDVTGATLYGLPVVAIGHNAQVAWTHTVSTAQRFTLYQLTLDPGDPTSYIYDGEAREMTAREVTIQVPGPDGELEERTHTFYETHFGPVIQTPALPWLPTVAFALRDANLDNGRGLDTFLEMGMAGSVADLRNVLDRNQGLPWVNTIAADVGGTAYYGDHSVVPHVTPAKMAACGFPVMDGSRSDCEWGSDPDAAVPGIFGPSSLPQLTRTDYTTNMNNSYWLSNPEQPLEGFSPIIGPERSNLGLRPRLGLHMVQQRLAGADGLDGTGFTLDRLQAVMFNNRHYGAELVRDDLVGHCSANPAVVIDGAEVDLTAACDVLADWDLRVNRDSRGGHIFREFVAAGGLQFAVPFNVADPLNTPHTLNTADPRVLQALGRAVQRLTNANIALDARWGDVQFVVRAGDRIEIHGGGGGEGVFNAISSAPLTPGLGYPEVLSGTSFVMTAELTPDGPRSQALVTYSQSTNPASPHLADQTRLYSEKIWVDMKFDEADILADPHLRTYSVTESMADCRNGGWQDFQRPEFASQGECVRYFATARVG